MTVYYHVADNRSTDQKGFLALISNSLFLGSIWKIHPNQKESQMTLQILSFVKLSDKQIDLIHQSYPHCQCRCIRPSEVGDVLSEVDILLGYDAQMDMEKYLPQMPRLQWIHTYSAGVEKLLSNVTFSQSDILLTNSRGIHGIPIQKNKNNTIRLVILKRSGLRCEENTVCPLLTLHIPL